MPMTKYGIIEQQMKAAVKKAEGEYRALVDNIDGHMLTQDMDAQDHKICIHVPPELEARLRSDYAAYGWELEVVTTLKPVFIRLKSKDC